MNQKKLLTAGVAFTEISGISMAIASLIPGGSTWAASLVLSDPGVETIAARLGTGIGGAVMTGWAITMWSLIRSQDKIHRGEAVFSQELGRAIASGIAIWFVLDGIVSIGLGATTNLLFNTLYLLALGGPAWMLMNGGSDEELTIKGSSPTRESAR